MTADLQPLTDPAAARYRERYDAARAGLPGVDRGWVAGLRDRAAAALVANGFPTRHVEAWKYTDLRRVLRTDFAAPAAGKTPDAATLSSYLPDDGPVAVFVDGAFCASLSGLDGGARLVPLEAALDAGDAVAERLLTASAAIDRPGLGALNTALMQDGMLIDIGDNVALDRPVRLAFVTTDGWAGEAHLRNVISLGSNARATIAIDHVALGSATGLVDSVTDIELGPGAALTLIKQQREAVGAFHIAQTHVRIGRDATFDGFALATGGRIARNEICVRLDGEGAECTLNGLTLARGRQHIDTTTNVDHATAHGRSAQLYKNIVDDRARSVFLGRVHVAPHAQKTDARQMIRNLLLAPGARADTKPELIIHADDVKCGHGATVGDLDAEALFYLRSRGIGAEAARAMLIEGFAGEMLDLVADDDLRAGLAAQLHGWLAGVGGERKAA